MWFTCEISLSFIPDWVQWCCSNKHSLTQGLSTTQGWFLVSDKSPVWTLTQRAKLMKAASSPVAKRIEAESWCCVHQELNASRQECHTMAWTSIVQASHTATIWEKESIIFQCWSEIKDRIHGVSLRTVTCVNNKSVHQQAKMSEQNNWLFSITHKWLKSQGQPRRLTKTWLMRGHNPQPGTPLE